MSLTTELLSLFDQETVQASQWLDPSLVDAAAVGKASRDLLALKGDPGRQVEMVMSLAPQTAQALCRWINDPGFWRAVGGINRH